MSRRPTVSRIPSISFAFFALLLSTQPAHAHLNSTGLGPIYDGLMHFLTSPEDIAAVLALALLAGLRGAEFGRRLLFVLPAAWLVGGVGGWSTSAWAGSGTVSAIWMLLLGGLLALNAKASLRVTTLLAMLLGAYNGYSNGAGMGGSIAALSALEAIEANENIPDELYFVPKNLGIKAEILARMGNTKASNDLYEKSADLFDAFLSKVPTPTIERQLLSDLRAVYAGYFASLSDQGRVADAFRAIERARGRVVAQALARHEVIPPHEPNPSEQQLTKLNLQLLNTDDSTDRAHILDAIYSTEQQISVSTPADAAPLVPVGLRELQYDLRPSELLVEYVLDDPHSYALAVTRESVHRYMLPSEIVLEQEAMQYRSELVRQKTDMPLAQQLFDGLLSGIPELKAKRALIVVPDGKLHLLPFAAVVDSGQYLLALHLVTVAPSGTVLDILRRRDNPATRNELPYVGVAAWTSKAPATTLLASIRRAVSGPQRHELVALPDSRYEVETIASDLPKPSTVLLGSRATETNFKQLPLSQYNVIHLALHGYADPEVPDRSALIFAPESQGSDDGLLQVREIRRLHLDASLVTLSACDTGVGPVGEEGVANIVNAFIEAGAQSVVSTLWALEDHATAQLMTDFYEHLGRHEEKAEALRRSQLDMMKSGAPPYYWAGFQLDGEPSAGLFKETATTNSSNRSSR
jgi:CHAT domain-containing protein/hydrogenase/urease accessory protein HupE